MINLRFKYAHDHINIFVIFCVAEKYKVFVNLYCALLWDKSLATSRLFPNLKLVNVFFKKI
jgi:hypothetical protein